MVYELKRVLRVCNGFLCSMSVTYDGAVLLWHLQLQLLFNYYLIIYNYTPYTVIEA